jgi:acetyl-CoA synthetase
MRGPKPIGLKVIVDEACEISKAKGNHDVHTVLVYQRLGEKFPVKMVEGRDLWYHEEIAKVSAECPVEWVDAEDPLFMLYTSGSTGKPKGVLHTVGGYMLYTAVSFKYIFDYKPGDVYWCTADAGWITGHSYIVYGPLFEGATQVMFEGVPTFPDAGRCWDIVDKFKVTQFYTAPTLIRLLMKMGEVPVKRYSRASLRLLGTVGEPINPEAWVWYYRTVGDSRCPIVDTYWQTETGGFLLTPFPGATPLKPGSATFPFFGIIPEILDPATGVPIEGPGEGALVIAKPWPGLMRTVYLNHDRFEQTYFSTYKGYYVPKIRSP